MPRLLVLVLLALPACGCSSLTNPVADGVPVNRLPDEVFPRAKADLRPVPLTLLRQKPPAQYAVDAGDVLAVVANEVLGTGDQAVPVRFLEERGAAPVTGYPVPVRDDGSISIPLLKPLDVKGKTVKQVEQLLLDAITGRNGGPELVKEKAARVSVQLLKKREVQVLVVREDTAGGGSSGGFNVGSPFAGVAGTATIPGNRRGTGFNLSLPAGENDLLHALNATGGLPGTDAKNEVVIVRGGKTYCDAADASARTIRIPLRVYADQPLTIREDDVILREGDVVSIESRAQEVFYTAGIIGSYVIPLPRDTDLDVLQALTYVRGPLVNGSFTQTAFTSQAVNTGLGNPNASLVTVLRQLPNKQQVAIRVDVNKALRDPRERVLMQPGDFLVMQERPGEAITRYLTQTFRFSNTFNLLRQQDANTVLSATLP